MRAHHRDELADRDLPVAVEVARLHDDVDEAIGLVRGEPQVVLGQHDVHHAVELRPRDAAVAVDVVQVEQELELLAGPRGHEPLRDRDELLGRLEPPVAAAQGDEQAIGEEEAPQPERPLHGHGVDPPGDPTLRE